jgi:hypothetical protein
MLLAPLDKGKVIIKVHYTRSSSPSHHKRITRLSKSNFLSVFLGIFGTKGVGLFSWPKPDQRAVIGWAKDQVPNLHRFLCHRCQGKAEPLWRPS